MGQVIGSPEDILEETRTCVSEVQESIPEVEQLIQDLTIVTPVADSVQPSQLGRIVDIMIGANASRIQLLHVSQELAPFIVTAQQGLFGQVASRFAAATCQRALDAMEELRKLRFRFNQVLINHPSLAALVEREPEL